MVQASAIKEHAEVIGADGVHIGTVDSVEGDRIKLTKKDSQPFGERPMGLYKPRARYLQPNDDRRSGRANSSDLSLLAHRTPFLREDSGDHRAYGGNRGKPCENPFGKPRLEIWEGYIRHLKEDGQCNKMDAPRMAKHQLPIRNEVHDDVPALGWCNEKGAPEGALQM